MLQALQHNRGRDFPGSLKYSNECVDGSHEQENKSSLNNDSERWPDSITLSIQTGRSDRSSLTLRLIGFGEGTVVPYRPTVWSR